MSALEEYEKWVRGWQAASEESDYPQPEGPFSVPRVKADAAIAELRAIIERLEHEYRSGERPATTTILHELMMKANRRAEQAEAEAAELHEELSKWIALDTKHITERDQQTALANGALTSANNQIAKTLQAEVEFLRQYKGTLIGLTHERDEARAEVERLNKMLDVSFSRCHVPVSAHNKAEWLADLRACAEEASS